MDKFTPSWWLSNPHLQTLYPSLFRKPVNIELQTERLETPDNDFVDIAYPEDNQGRIVLVFHGLEGSLKSHYAKGMVKALYDAGLFPVFMHFRGCSGTPNRTTRRYHSAETSDPGFFLETLLQRYPDRDVYAVGFSLGGNMLLNWLSQLGVQSPIKKAVVISVPFDLSLCEQRLRKGFSRIYLKHLMKKILGNLRLKYDAGLFPLDYDKAKNSKTFWEFDENVTAPLHGFKGADDYYAKCSSRFYLKDIRTPTLVIHAKDDPFLSKEALPSSEEISPSLTLELSEHGGHVGFITGYNPFQPVYWAEQRAVNFFISA